MPVNLECRTVHILNLGSHELVIGEIIEVYATDDCLTEGKPDINKIKPFLWGGGPTISIMTSVGRSGSFNIGKQFNIPPK